MLFFTLLMMLPSAKAYRVGKLVGEFCPDLHEQAKNPDDD